MNLTPERDELEDLLYDVGLTFLPKDCAMIGDTLVSPTRKKDMAENRGKEYAKAVKAIVSHIEAEVLRGKDDTTYEYIIDDNNRLTLKYPVYKPVEEAIKTTAHTIKRYQASGKGLPAFLEGDTSGDYIVLERTNIKSHKNRKLLVKCRLCGEQMYRYTNKLNTPHRFCPAYKRSKSADLQRKLEGKP
jgi:hypothetical protein